jgi:hypothetical protein
MRVRPEIRNLPSFLTCRISLAAACNRASKRWSCGVCIPPLFGPALCPCSGAVVLSLMWGGTRLPNVTHPDSKRRWGHQREVPGTYRIPCNMAAREPLPCSRLGSLTPHPPSSKSPSHERRSQFRSLSHLKACPDKPIPGRAKNRLRIWKTCAAPSAAAVRWWPMTEGIHARFDPADN